MTSKVAFITGITGQDGSYLAELLLSKNYEVHGLIRRCSQFNTQLIDHLYKDPHVRDTRFFLHHGDLSSSDALVNLLREIQPHEIYHLAAQSHVRVSFELPQYTGEVTGLGTLRVLEAVRQAGLQQVTRIYNANSSEAFGDVKEIPQSETTPFNPQSPYAAAKVYGHWICKVYRESYGMFICSGILFNHESPRRGKTFVTRKITRAVAAIAGKQQEVLYLGNLDAERDWGYAQEYVRGMWLMLQQDQPDDFVLATGVKTKVRDFVTLAFAEVGIEIKWSGQGLDEVGLDQTGTTRVKIDPRYFRPAEVDILLGDATKAEQQLNWKSRVGIKELVHIMVQHDLRTFNLSQRNLITP